MARNSTANPDYSILAALETPITRPRTTFIYHCGLVLTAVTMVLLFAAYVSLIGLLAYVVYYHAVHNWGPIMDLGEVPSRLVVIKFFIYLIPLLAGLVVLFFMLKPVFAGRPKRAQPLALNPVHEPLLYAFIEKICDTVGAPSPKRIDLDCRLNASAGFRRGLFSFFRNDMVLVIGLPLVANMTARELAGVVAHEFGHFTQGAGMRLSYVIRSISFWFARAAYERDAWDVALERASIESPDGRFTILVMTVQLVIWLSRLVLKLLMLIGVAVAGFMLRQMEYDADAYTIKVTGSDGCEQLQRKLATLRAASLQADKQLFALWRKTNSLPDNLPEIVRKCREELPAAILQKIDNNLGFHRTGVFDSHPSPADRIRRARQAAESGIFHDDRPASSLFVSFDHPSRFVTFLHYTDDLGIPISQDMLLPVNLTPIQTADSRDSRVSDHYFLGVLPLLLPIRIPPPVPSDNVESRITELERISSGLQQVAGQLAPLASQYTDAVNRLIKSRADLVLHQAGMFAIPGIPVPIEPVRTAEAEAVATLVALSHSVREVATALMSKLHVALSLRLSDRGEYGAEPVSAERINELVIALNQAADQYPQQRAILDALAILEKIVELKNSAGETPALERALASQIQAINELVTETASSTEASQPKSGLQIAKRQRQFGDREMTDLRLKTTRWFAEYHEKIEELCQVAQAVDAGN